MLFRADQFKACAAAPETLGFEDAPNGTVNNPFTYFGLNFSATVTGIGGSPIPPAIEVVTDSTQEFAEIETGSKALESTFQFQRNGNENYFLTVTDLGSANNGAIVAISAYLNGIDYRGLQGTSITIDGMLQSTTQPSCQSSSFPLRTAGPQANGGPTKVLFGNGTENCIVDVLSLMTTRNNAYGTANGPTRISLNDFVVCKANPGSALKGVLPP